MTDRVQETKEALVQAIRESEVCRKFESCKEKMAGSPEKLVMLNAFREKNYRLQENGEAGSEEVSRELQKEKEHLLADPLCAEYLAAELAYCRMLQQICMEIMNITDLQL